MQCLTDYSYCIIDKLANTLYKELGLSLLCSKIFLLCFWAFPQFFAYYAYFYAFQMCIMLLHL